MFFERSPVFLLRFRVEVQTWWQLVRTVLTQVSAGLVSSQVRNSLKQDWEVASICKTGKRLSESRVCMSTVKCLKLGYAILCSSSQLNLLLMHMTATYKPSLLRVCCPRGVSIRDFAAEKGGCIIVDATRKGKRFPDSMSKTIPIWACVINRALADIHKNLNPQEYALDIEENGAGGHSLDYWDCQLHLPIWVSETEKNNIANLLDSWVEALKACPGANLIPLARALRKPLRTLWVSQKTVIWINEVVDTETLDFTPIFLVSASQPVSCTQRMTDAEFSWSYIPGAADDEESWARGLTPALFWRHAYDLVNDGPVDCNRKVADLVERERVYRALRGLDAPQVKLNSFGKKLADPVDRRSDASNSFLSGSSYLISYLDLGDEDARKLNDSIDGCRLTLEEREINALQDGFSQNMRVKCMDPLKGLRPDMVPGLHWIGSTGLAVGDSSCCKLLYLSLLFWMWILGSLNTSLCKLGLVELRDMADK